MSGARRFEDLDAWKLSVQLRDRVFQETATGPVAGDHGLREQVRDSSASAPRNIAEGFGAYYPKEFARFARIARRSLMETRNHILDGQTREYFSVETSQELLTLCRRALGATTGLLKYLESCDNEAPTGWKARQPPRKPRRRDDR